MLLRVCLLTTVLAAAIVLPLGCFGERDAFASPSASGGSMGALSVRGGWSVSSFERTAGQKSGPSYCSLSRRYDNGSILSLGKSVRDDYSLAVDFQHPALDMGESLTVNIQPSAGQLRSYNVSPVSQQAFVIRLGKDETFLKTILGSGRLAMDIGGDPYVFPLPELQEGILQLGACVAAVKEASSGAGTVPLASSSPAEDKRKSGADVLNAVPSSGAQFVAGKVLDRDTVKKAKENPPVLEKPLAAKAEKFLTVAAIGVSQKVEQEGQKGPATITTPEQTKEKDKNAPVASYDAPYLSPPPEKPRDIAAMTGQTVVAAGYANEELSALDVAGVEPAAGTDHRASDAEIPKKKEALEPAQKNAPILQSAADRSEILSMRKEIEALKSDISSYKVAEKNALQEKAQDQSREEDLSRQIVELKAKNSQMEDLLRKTQKQIAEAVMSAEAKAVSRLRDLEDKMKAVQGDNITLSKEIESLRSENKHLSKIASASASGAAAETSGQASVRYDEAQQEIKRLSEAVETAKSRCDVEKAEIEKMLFDPAVASQEQIEKIQNLEKQLAGAKKGGAALASSAANEASMKEKLSALEKQLEQQKTAFDSEREAMAKQIAQLTDTPSLPTDEMVALENDNRLLKQSLNDLKIAVSSKNKEIADLELMRAKDAGMVSTLREESAKKETLPLFAADVANSKNEQKNVRNTPTLDVDKAFSPPMKNNHPTARSSGFPPHGLEKAEEGHAVDPNSYNKIAPAAGAVSSAALLSSDPAVQKIGKMIRAAGVGEVKASRGDSRKPKSGASVEWNTKTEGIRLMTWMVPSIGEKFDTLVKRYIGSLKAQCSSDFASMPSPSAAKGGVYGPLFTFYDAACIGGAVDSDNPAAGESYGILFFEDQGHFVAVLARSDISDMARAPAYRDKIARTIHHF